MVLDNIIQEKIESINNRNNSRQNPLLIIFKGFYTKNLMQVKFTKLLNIELNIQLTELIDSSTELLIESTTKPRSTELV